MLTVVRSCFLLTFHFLLMTYPQAILKKNCLFEIAAWGFLDPGRREGIFFCFSDLKLNLLKIGKK